MNRCRTLSESLKEEYTDRIGVLLVVSGPAGAGKGSVVKWLNEHDENVFLSISETTRAPRKGDEEGVTYYFVDRKTFEERIEEDHYFEFAQIYGNYYGTPKNRIIDMLKEGKDVILEIEMQGAAKVKEMYPQAVTVFIMPPSLEELRERITGRGSDSEDEINRRMSCAKDEIALAPNYDYIIVNKKNALVESGKNLQSVLCAEHLKTSRILNQNV